MNPRVGTWGTCAFGRTNCPRLVYEAPPEAAEPGRRMLDRPLPRRPCLRSQVALAFVDHRSRPIVIQHTALSGETSLVRQSATSPRRQSMTASNWNQKCEESKGRTSVVGLQKGERRKRRRPLGGSDRKSPARRLRAAPVMTGGCEPVVSGESHRGTRPIPARPGGRSLSERHAARDDQGPASDPLHGAPLRDRQATARHSQL